MEEYFYAQLNGNNICIGILQLSGETIQDDRIRIENYDISYVWKKYENDVWSTEKYEPTSTAPIEEFEQLKQSNLILSQTLGNVTLENANLKQQVGTLTQTVANLMVGGTI